jgi:hypothetical protein
MTRSLPLLFVCALLAGCGGGDDEGSSEGGDGGGGGSRDAFVAEVNKICAEGEQAISEIDPVPQGEEAPKTPDEVRTFTADALERTAEAYQPYLDRLRDVEAPEELADGYAAFLEGIEGAFDKIPEVADATRANDRDKLEELAGEFTQVAEETRPFAEQNGLTDCLPDQAESGSE